MNNAVKIYKDNLSIERILDRCLNCGICKQTCKVREGLEFDENSELCVNCGQCVQTCPAKSLVPKNDIDSFLNSKGKKTLIAYTSPSVRVAFGDIFDLQPGEFVESKLVGLLKMMGFDYVFDTTFAADLTIMEEANELVERIKNNSDIPMFTSCCPAWVKYAEQFYPEVLPYISTCKSPIGMMGVIVKEYFCKNNNIENPFTVAITPCTAKKYEIKRKEIDGTDLVLTLSEIGDYIKDNAIKYEDIKEAQFDNFTGTSSGVIFGNSGGVMEAALRTAYNILTNENIDNIDFKDVRGIEGLKEASLKINGKMINVAVINGITNAKKVIEDVIAKQSKYHYIEIMNCTGGCIGGGGMPKINIFKEREILTKRIESLYDQNDKLKIKSSHNNPQINKLYDEFLNYPLSDIAIKLLHTEYSERKDY